MSLHRGNVIVESADNLKYGDVILLYYDADPLSVVSGGRSGFVMADLSQ